MRSSAQFGREECQREIQSIPLQLPVNTRTPSYAELYLIVIQWCEDVRRGRKEEEGGRRREGGTGKRGKGCV